MFTLSNKTFLICIFLFGFDGAIVFTQDLHCPRLMESFIYQAQRGSIGRSENPLEDFKKTTPNQLHARDATSGTFAIETDILELFSVAPEYRDLKNFERKWNLSEEQSLDLLTFYSTRIFFDDAEIAGNPREVLSRLQTVSREHYLGEPQDKTTRSYLFYSSNLTRLSVPEFARLRGISEGSVYKELSRLGLSLPEAFGDKLQQATELFGQGHDTKEIAAKLGVGQQALEFALHHIGTRNRGVEWNRTFFFNGRAQWEIPILVALHDNGFSHQEIANRLNQMAGITDPASPEIRTAAAVAAKLGDLGLTEKRALGEISVYDPRYGFLKEGGKLNPNLAIHFIMDHYHMPDEWIAEQLGVTETGFNAFFQRHHLVREKGRVTYKRSSNVQRQMDRYEKQRWSVKKFVEWMKNNNGRLPQGHDFGIGVGKVGIAEARFYGNSDYLPGNKSYENRYFDSKEAALKAVKVEAAEQGMAFRYIDTRWHPIPDTLRGEIQEESAVAVVDWMVANGRVFKSTDFGAGPGKIGFQEPQFYGTDKYQPGGDRYATRYFDSKVSAIKEVKKKALERKFPFRFIDVIWVELPSEIKAEIQDEATTAVVDWMAVNGRSFKRTDFGAGKGKIGFNEYCFYGTGSYNSEGDNYLNRYFDSKVQALTSVKKKAMERGIRFRYIDFNWQGGIPDEIRTEVRQEAVSAVVDWMVANGRVFKKEDFGAGLGKIGINDGQFFGNDSYRPGGVQWSNRYFDSREEALNATREEVARRGLPIIIPAKWQRN